MTETGTLTTPGLARSKETEPDAQCHEGTTILGTPSYNVQAPLQYGHVGRRSHCNEVAIGLALGSPGHPPLPPDFQYVDTSQEFGLSSNRLGQPGTVSDIGSRGSAMARKGSKWKSFGMLFGRKNSSARIPHLSPFYQLDKTCQQGPDRQIIVQDRLETSSPRRERIDSVRKVHGKRWRANTLEATSKSETNGLLRRNSSRRKRFRRKNQGADEVMPGTRDLHTALSADAQTATLQLPRPPTGYLRICGEPSLLQVQIPDIKMERYSVMFGDVLNPKPRQKLPPSLLSRRQGQLKDLQPATEPKFEEPLNDELPNPHRRDESTSSKFAERSPSFSLFPSTTTLSARNEVMKPLPKPSPLSRSVTAPNTTLSPPRSAVRASKSPDQDHVFVIVHTPDDNPSHVRHLSSNPTCTSANSTQASFSDDPENTAPSVTDKEHTKHNDQVPRGAFPIRSSSMNKLPLADSQRHFQEIESMNTAAEVSVARQVSISRQQRQLLIPIVPKFAQQPVQPTVVEGKCTTASRKSYHLTLEDV